MFGLIGTGMKALGVASKVASIAMKPTAASLGTLATGGMNLVSAEPPEKLESYQNAIKNAKTPEQKEVALEWVKSQTPSRRARRFVTQCITLVWVFHIVVPVIWEMLGNQPLKSIENAENNIHYVFMLVAMFYLPQTKSGGVLAGIASSMASNMGKKKK